MISARVPAEVIEKIQQWADENGCSRSMAIAQLLAKAVGIDRPIKGKAAPAPADPADTPKRTRPKSAPPKKSLPRRKETQ